MQTPRWISIKPLLKHKPVSVSPRGLNLKFQYLMFEMGMSRARRTSV